MKILHYLLYSLVFLFCSYNLKGQNKIDIYVSAHADDWQLFMNPNAYTDVKSSDHKVVFIHITAGDAGAGIGYNNYYLAREEGSLRALRFMSNTFTSGAGLGTDMNENNVTINGHQILKYSYRNIVAYFLRLPDGNLNGSGYTSTGNESVQRLYNGLISSISAVDGSTTYNSITDFTNTMQSLVELEANGSQLITFNIADDDASINPGDHSDHIYSSKIFQDVANSIGDVEMNLYSEYHTSERPQNIFENDYLVSAATWGVTASGLSDNFHYSTWDGTHNAWIGKQYYRVVHTDNNPETTPNIALNKPSSASSYEPNSGSSEANDGNYSASNNY
ncbi:PIG-L family deacetylase, partial [Winogradskyella alexanderae]